MSVWVMVAGIPERKRRGKNMMTSLNTEELIGKHCKLQKPVRDHEGRSRYSEQPRIIREVSNLDRRMYLVQFDDGATTFLFPDEVVIQYPSLRRRTAQCTSDGCAVSAASGRFRTDRAIVRR